MHKEVSRPLSLMSARIARFFWLLAAAALLWLAVPVSARAVVYSFGLHPDKERLVFRFDNAVPPGHVLSRTGRTELFLELPPGFELDLPGADTFGLRDARLVSGIEAVPGGVSITLADPAFGYVSFALEDQNKLVVDVFPDRLGARWKPKAGSAAPRPVPAPARRPAPASGPSGVNTSQAAPAIPPGQTPEPASDAEPAARPAPAAVPDSLPSYVFRGQVRQVGPDTALAGSSRQAAKPVEPPEPAPAARQPVRPPEPESIPQQAAAPEQASDGASGRAPGGALTQAPLAVRVTKPGAGRPSASLRGAVGGAAGGEFRGLAEPPGTAVPLRPPGEEGTFEQAVQDVVGRDTTLDQAMDAAPAPSPAMDMDVLDAASEPAPEEPLDLGQEGDMAAEGGEAVDAEAGEQGPLPPASASDEEMRKKFKEVLTAAQSAIVGGDHKTGLQQLDLMLSDKRLPKDMREETLYTRADVLYSMYSDSLKDHYDEINGAYEQAMNFNLNSERVPSALLRRGMLNLHVENIPEAKAYFSLLRKKYPNDMNVPLTYFYWGEYYYDKGMDEEAAQEYEHLVQVYPDSKFVREASVKLALALRRLGYDDNAFQIVDFIEKRWPRFYIEYPPFLRLLGDTAYTHGDTEKAKDHYWTYYNLDPKGDDADMILARLGDIYSEAGQQAASAEVYQKAVADFPEREGGLIADMRLAEKGVYDDPSIDYMFSVFDQPYSRKPSEIYTRIVTDFPDSGLAPLAQTKLAIWHLWNRKYMNALGAVSDFLAEFPGSKLQPRAEEVGLEAFSRLVEQVMVDDNYPRVMALWEEYPFVRENWQRLDPSTRLRLAQSFWNRGNSVYALDLVAGLLRGDQQAAVSEGALSLALSVLVEQQSWDRVLELERLKDQWNLAPSYVRQLNYALALAHENLGHAQKSREMWMALGNDLNLAKDQRAYALYFLAENAREKRNLREAFDFAQDAFSLFIEIKSTDTAKIKDVLRILIDVTESSGRARDALRYGLEFQKYLSPDDPNAPAFNYRLANLYRQAGEVKMWREILESLSKSVPGSLYGRMAQSDLQSYTLEQAAREYIPPVQIQ